MDFQTLLIVLTGLSLGVLAGFVMHRSDYCVAGMFRDFFLFGNPFMLRTLLLLVIVSAALFELARLAGLLPLHPFPLLGSPSLANLAGGALFGVGMVLAGGCVVGTLYKMGSGSAVSGLAVAGLLAGSALYAEIYPAWSSLVKATTLFQGRITVPQILGIQPPVIIVPLAVIASLFLLRWRRDGKLTRRSLVEGYLQPGKAAVYLALIGLSSCVLIGMPLGITTAYSKMGAYAAGLVVKTHVDALAYFRTVPLDYFHPIMEIRLKGGPGPHTDAISLIQFPVIIGIVLGGALSAFLVKEFRLYFRLPLRQYASAFIGGAIMGLAARMAPACNVWHLFGGLPILAVQSILFLVGLFPGAWLGSMIMARIVVRSSDSHIPHLIPEGAEKGDCCYGTEATRTDRV